MARELIETQRDDAGGEKQGDAGETHWVEAEKLKS
jgi:hypothetical protein